jgi:uncharacterized protein (DUF1800 family)
MHKKERSCFYCKSTRFVISKFNKKQSKMETHTMTMLTALDARHLLTRTGFTPSEAEVKLLAGLSREAAIDKILQSAKSNQPKEAIPAFVNAPPPTPARDLKTQEERQEQRRMQIREGFDLKVWWLWEMLTTPNPLAERMTLFWHNHFAAKSSQVTRDVAAASVDARTGTGQLCEVIARYRPRPRHADLFGQRQ